MPKAPLTFARFLATAENRAALGAVRQVAEAIGRKKNSPASTDELAPKSALPTLLIHGPPGCGKTHLVQALATEATQQRRDLVLHVLAAGDLMRPQQPTFFTDREETGDVSATALEEARHCDLLIVEDLQHLHPRLEEALVQVMDYLAARQRPIVLTANAGPQKLCHRGERFSARLTNRLAGGLVVAMDPLGAPSRLALLQLLAQRRQLAVPTDALRWLADCLTGGGRQLEGAVAQLEALVKARRGQIDLADVESHFRDQADAGRPTVQRITERVCSYFHVEPSDLQSQRRHRNVLVPRQVGMYLARQLTQLSLEQIGDYFGGRDHSTVLHSCQKVERVLEHDAVMSGAVREIHAGLA